MSIWKEAMAKYRLLDEQAQFRVWESLIGDLLMAIAIVAEFGWLGLLFVFGRMISDAGDAEGTWGQ